MTTATLLYIPLYTNTFRRRSNPITAVTAATSNKHIHRLLSSLETVSNDSIDSDRLISKFVSSSSKSTALQTLSHLLSHSSSTSAAISMYDKITQAPWFQWNPKLAATVAAQLEKSGRLNDAETLISDSVSKLTNNYRDLMLFYCSLIESSSSHYRVHHTYAILTSSSFQAAGKRRRRRRRGIHESMVKALCNLNSPIEAEDVMMNTKGFHPSAFEFRLVSQAYGRSGRFDEMLRVLTEMEKQGFPVDTICSNIVLSCFNVVLNSCDTLSSILLDLDTLPLSFPAVISKIHLSSPEEAAVVSEIQTRTPELLTQLLSQGSDGCKLDLHGCHLSTAYMVLMEWIEEMRMRFGGKAVESYDGGREEQDQVTVVCGGGKHSNVRGDSPLRKLVSKMMYRMSSPLRLDKKNNGRFISKSQKFKSWITNSESQMTIN